jgi:hypothetical protein
MIFEGFLERIGQFRGFRPPGMGGARGEDKGDGEFSHERWT